MKDIIRTAKIFKCRELKGRVNLESIKNYLQSKGYTVNFYDVEKDNKLLTKYGLNEYAKTVHAFTVCSKELKAVFIDKQIKKEKIIYSLLHETAHIVLNHLDKTKVGNNDRLYDMQAEAFAYEVLNHKSKTHIYAIIAVILLVFGIGIYKNINDSKMVYVTSTGAKYHRENCIHVQNIDCTVLTKGQARKNYDPCKVCNP